VSSYYYIYGRIYIYISSCYYIYGRRCRPSSFASFFTFPSSFQPSAVSCASQSMRRVVEAGTKDTELLPRGYTLVRVSAGCIINATRSRLAFLAVAHDNLQSCQPTDRPQQYCRKTHHCSTAFLQYFPQYCRKTHHSLMMQKNTSLTNDALQYCVAA
jgi:hypothetical protein